MNVTLRAYGGDMNPASSDPHDRVSKNPLGASSGDR
jgi:hypothetical protein